MMTAEERVQEMGIDLYEGDEKLIAAALEAHARDAVEEVRDA